MLRRTVLFFSSLTTCAACSAGSAGPAASYGGAAGEPSGAPDTGVSGSGPIGAGGASGAGGGVKPDAGRPYDPDAGFDWPEAVDAGKCQAGTYSGSYDCTVDFNGIVFPITGQVSFELSPSANGEFLEIKDGKLVADVQGQVSLAGDLVGKLECLTNRFQATIKNGTYTFSFLGLPVPNPFGGDLSGTLDRLTSTMTGQWNLASQAPVLGGQPPKCSGPWRVTLQP
jgi:hypothetical protein